MMIAEKFALNNNHSITPSLPAMLPCNWWCISKPYMLQTIRITTIYTYGYCWQLVTTAQIHYMYAKDAFKTRTHSVIFRLGWTWDTRFSNPQCRKCYWQDSSTFSKCRHYECLIPPLLYISLWLWINICELILLCICPTSRKERWFMIYLYLKNTNV